MDKGGVIELRRNTHSIVMRQLALDLAPPPAPTLANFAPGANARALAAVRELVDGGGRAVLYLWGAPGSGRSHLLRAAATERPDLLTLDDVQRLSPPAQIAAFDSFNTHARVLAAGDAPPARLAVRDDLRTRLGSGVVIELVPLADEDKLAALRAHAAERGITIASEVLEYLFRHLRRDMGTQMAMLDALDRYSLATQRALTVPLAKLALEDLERGPA